MISATKWRALAFPGLAWSVTVLGTASAGLFLGLGQPAHSDMAKFKTLLALHDRLPGEVIVKLSKSGKQALRSQTAARLFDGNNFRVEAASAFETNDNFYLVKLSGDEQTAEFLETAAKNPNFQYAEPNYIVKALGQRDEAPAEVIPNDPDFNLLWAMKNTGQKDKDGTVGNPGSDIGATKAWSITTGNKDVIVAVIDTGVDYTHPDLKDNIYQNDAECSKGANGIDDDSNGFVDDCHGWNFAGTSSNDPMDDNEHGTHVSGTIGAKGNDGVGVAGVNWTTSILPVKFLTATGSGSLADAVKAIQYATLMHAKVMNNSWGGGGFTQSMFDAISAAKDAGALFVAAAGNDSQNADSTPHYPAGYQLDNVISVAATTNTDTLAGFSTYGKRSVHISAPGNQIYSSVPGGKYDTFSGTSMATPHVTGAAALVWGTDTTQTFAQVKDRLLRSRDYVGGLSRKVASSGRLNVYNALTNNFPPSPEPAESDWQDFAIPSPIESAHPYDSNSKQSWAIQGPANAKYMRVVFSKLDLEDGYDFVKVVDVKGVEMDSMSGTGTNVASFYVSGSSLTLNFTSDSTQNQWGFAVGKVQVVYNK